MTKLIVILAVLSLSVIGCQKETESKKEFQEYSDQAIAEEIKNDIDPNIIDSTYYTEDPFNGIAQLSVEHGEILNVIQLYFGNYNDINRWKEYASTKFIESVIENKIDISNKSLDEMVKEYSKLGKHDGVYKITEYALKQVKWINDSEILILVTYLDEDGYGIDRTYRINKLENKWLFNEFLLDFEWF